MKKTVIIILIILPIVLLIAIAIAGRIRSQFETVFVEKVEFIDEFDTVYNYDDIFQLTVGEQKETIIRITPNDADNQKVTYSSDNTRVCTVDENGVLFGVASGKATITVKTDDGNKTAFLIVTVTGDKVIGVTLPYETLTLSVGAEFKLTPTVELPDATDKSVTYRSTNTSVCKVDANGNVTALTEGTADIVVTTKDGGFTATCTITVVKGASTLAFDFTGADFITLQIDTYVTTQAMINLKEYIVFDESLIQADDIYFRIESGSKYCTLQDGVLTLLSSGMVRIKAYVGNAYSPTYQATFTVELSTK